MENFLEQILGRNNTTPLIEDELVSYFKKRLKLSNEKYEEIMKAARKIGLNIQPIKKIRATASSFSYLAKANLVPMSFYLKYCFPVK